MDNSAKENFYFGIESEYLICDKNFNPLWYKDVHFSDLRKYLDQIDLNNLRGDLNVLDEDFPNKAKNPYIVEGYHTEKENGKYQSILVKGVEIRTPLNSSITDCLDDLKTLYTRLKNKLLTHDLQVSALSYHPTQTLFLGPQEDRSYEFWKWATSAMTTYGPDLNISIPKSFQKEIDHDILRQVVNYYIPALSLLSFASPFYQGGPWVNQNHEGLSYRTFQRTLNAPPLKIHEGSETRYEFKSFEMTNNLVDFENYFLISLGLILGHKKLRGRAHDNSRIYELGLLSYKGFDVSGVTEKLNDFFSVIPSVLKEWGFQTASLTKVIDQILGQTCPAMDIIKQVKEKKSIQEILKERSEIINYSAEKEIRNEIKINY